jgi:REP element-mobilizing transposase RayT
MTYPRAHLVDAENGGFYHCVSRCVRRAWLCGKDPISGDSFEHRKEWVESYLLRLANIFAVNLYGYAVMSNHYHVIIETLPAAAKAFDDEEVARRWVQLSPALSENAANKRVAAILDNPKRLDKLRLRLGSLSWFMRYINEPIARRANKEDDCKGRFWEGRFKSFALLDDPAVVCGLAYVDLNPIRAGIVASIDQAPHTSIKRRIAHKDGDCAPLADLERFGLTLSTYRQLLEWTASLDRGTGAEPSNPTRDLLQRLGREPGQWSSHVLSNRLGHRAYGSANNLKRYAKLLGQRWIKGCRDTSSRVD